MILQLYALLQQPQHPVMLGNEEQAARESKLGILGIEDMRIGYSGMFSILSIN